MVDLRPSYRTIQASAGMDERTSDYTNQAAAGMEERMQRSAKAAPGGRGRLDGFMNTPRRYRIGARPERRQG